MDTPEVGSVIVLCGCVVGVKGFQLDRPKSATPRSTTARGPAPHPHLIGPTAASSTATTPNPRIRIYDYRKSADSDLRLP